MAAIELTWDNHNRLVQADQLIAYGDGDTGLEAGQQTVIEFRWRADSGDAWGEPTTRIVTTPPAASYDPPADGWVQITAYSIRDGITSWQAHVFEGYFIASGGGGFYAPGNRITDAGDRRITDAGDVRVTE